MPWFPPYRRRILDPFKPADVVVYREGDKAVAVDRSGEPITASTNHASAVQEAVNRIGKGKVVLVGEFVFTAPVDLAPGVVVEGLGVDRTVVTAPPGAPAFRYVQPSGSTLVVSRPLVLKRLTVKIPPTGGPTRQLRWTAAPMAAPRPWWRKSRWTAGKPMEPMIRIVALPTWA